MKIIPLINFFWIIVLLSNCRQRFEPPAIQNNLNALVIDGFINNSPDTTFIRLTRTKKIGEFFQNPVETGARLTLENEAGNVLYNFQEIKDGVYIVSGMNLDFNSRFRLRIFTSIGGEYVSDAIPVLKTPAVDSITWIRDGNGVSISVNTHDPANNTHYYRWEYTEVWQYYASYISAMIYEDNVLRDRLPQEFLHECWKSQPSKQLLFASSDRLSEDIIYHNTLRQIDQDAIELSVRYFMMVKQYAVTKDYYKYLEILKKLSEQTGSIFDVAPSELTGNIHAVTRKDEIVIGYLAASTVESKQIFINNEEVLPWRFSELCAIVDVTFDRVESYFSRGAYIPLYIDNVRSVVVGAEANCADCRKKGGTLIKPDFW